MKKYKKKGKFIYYILISILVLIAIILFIIIIILNNERNDINEKIANIDSINTDIILLKDNYDLLYEIDSKIEEMNNNNRLINNEIDNLTNNIKSLDSKIAKYRK